MVPISVLAAAMLVRADGDAPDPAEPAPQEQVVQAVPEVTVPPRTTLRRAVQSVSPTPVPVPQAPDESDDLDEADEVEQVDAADREPAPAPPTRDPVPPRTPRPSPSRTAPPPPSPSPTPTPDEAREQCMEQGALNLAACIEDLLNG